MSVYGSPAYQLGDEELVAAAANAPITKDQAAQAKLELKRMQGALRSWLKYRTINDKIAAGQAEHIPNPLLKRPGTFAPPAAAMLLRLSNDRAARESALAKNLYALLSEVFDSSQLPSPQDRNAAVSLARIAVGGKLPGDRSPEAAGFIWLWPLVVVIGVVAFTISQKIKSDAAAAAEHERIECIKAGKCTDTGFWMKFGAIAVVGWIAWDKMGLRERSKTFFARKNPLGPRIGSKRRIGPKKPKRKYFYDVASRRVDTGKLTHQATMIATSAKAAVRQYEREYGEPGFYDELKAFKHP